MSKTVTIRLSDDEYKKILNSAKSEHRPMSNFITHVVITKIDDLCCADPVEMREIAQDEELQKNLKRGHRDAEEKRGKFVA